MKRSIAMFVLIASMWAGQPANAGGWPATTKVQSLSYFYVITTLNVQGNVASKKTPCLARTVKLFRNGTFIQEASTDPLDGSFALYYTGDYPAIGDYKVTVTRYRYKMDKICSSTSRTFTIS